MYLAEIFTGSYRQDPLSVRALLKEVRGSADARSLQRIHLALFMSSVH